jgi:hypothetical protein
LKRKHEEVNLQRTSGLSNKNGTVMQSKAPQIANLTVSQFMAGNRFLTGVL